MSVRELGDQLCADLHARHLKQLGFRKSGRMFTRQRPGYSECISIQGSSWNSGEEPWHFYVNVSVTLNDIPLRTDSRAKYHADGRLEKLVDTAPPAFDLSSSNLAAIADELVEYIKRASDAVPNALDEIRKRAMQGLYSPLPVPASWLHPGQE